MKTFQLSNNVAVPAVGLGTWEVVGPAATEIVQKALQCGYRLIDTAAAYGNELAIGKVLKETAIPRPELFIEDKLWNTDRGYAASQEACKQSLRKLKTEYLDLYLLHWPACPKLHADWETINAETWRGLERLYQDGYVRAIGVCNFKEHHLEALKKTAGIMPMMNQLEFHPGYLQKELREYCKRNDILTTASSPLGHGRLLQQEMLQAIAAAHRKTAAQICLRFALQHGTVVIPKTTQEQRLLENLALFDFALSDAEMQQLDAIPYAGGLDIDSDEVTEFG